MSNQILTPRTDTFAREMGIVLAEDRRDLVAQMNKAQKVIDEHVAPLERELAAEKKRADEAERWISNYKDLYDEKTKQWFNSVTCVCADLPNVAHYIKDIEEERDHLKTARQLEKTLTATLKARVEEVDQLRAEVERLNMCLVAVMTCTLQNTESTVKDRIDKTNPYWSQAYGDTCAAIDREMKLRTRNAELLKIAEELEKSVKAKQRVSFTTNDDACALAAFAKWKEENK